MKKPTPRQIRSARESAKLSRTDAAALVYRSVRAWEKYETGERNMDPAIWELWQIKVREITGITGESDE